MSYRLIGGPGSFAGRAEVSYDGVWGTICENGFDDREALVLCRYLGFPYVSGYSFIVKSVRKQ